MCSDKLVLKNALVPTIVTALLVNKNNFGKKIITITSSLLPKHRKRKEKFVLGANED
jgi:hypothetical protein